MAEKTVTLSDVEAARQAEREVLEEVSRRGYSDACAFAIRLAMEEGLNNAIRHGNHHDPAKVVRLVVDVSNERVAITIRDEGQGFDPASVPDPTADENLEKPCGRGIMLMEAYMDEVHFNACGNEVHMIKRNR